MDNERTKIEKIRESYLEKELTKLEELKKLEDIAKHAINLKLTNNINYTDIKNQIIQELAEYIYDSTGRKPIILPVIMNIKRETKVTN